MEPSAVTKLAGALVGKNATGTCLPFPPGLYSLDGEPPTPAAPTPAFGPGEPKDGLFTFPYSGPGPHCAVKPGKDPGIFGGKAGS